MVCSYTAMHRGQKNVSDDLEAGREEKSEPRICLSKWPRKGNSTWKPDPRGLKSDPDGFLSSFSKALFLVCQQQDSAVLHAHFSVMLFLKKTT